MARRQEVYTVRIKRADDGAQKDGKPRVKDTEAAEAKKPAVRRRSADTEQAKKPAGKKDDAALTKKPAVKKDGATQTKKPAAKKDDAAQAKKPAARKDDAAQAKRPAAKKDDAAQAKRPAARRRAAAQAKQPENKKEETAQPARRARAVRREETLTRKERREKEKAQIAAYERKRAMSKGGGFSVFLMTVLTVAFDVLGLMLCAVRGDVLDPQAFMLLMVMAPLAMLTTLVLPRFAPVEPLLMALTNFLCGVSVVILYTVAPERGVKQAVFYVAGLVLMLLMSGVVSRLKKWRGLTGLSMVLGVGALILPLVFGQWNYGAKNWVTLPVIGSFQPSEFVKLSLVLTLAYSFSAHRTIWQMMPALVFAAACLVLLMLQRDLGTALIYYITTLVMFYAACGNVPLTLVGLGGGVGAAVMGYRMFAHVKVRVAMWRNPWSDALDKGYQIIQALLAIGSGGLFGVGLGQGTPDKIPAYFNDFIFAVVCEQLGMVFGICVIAVYALIVVRGVSVCLRSRRSFDLLLGCGVCAMLGIQTFMIVAGVIKMIPLTGVTMPFMSYGGSSLVSCLAMMGILHGIYGRAQRELEDDILGV